MKVSFFKRLAAYLIDLFIVTLLVSIVTVGFDGNKNTSKQLEDLITKYSNNEISASEYSDGVYNLEYQSQKDNVYFNIVNVVVFIGYYIVFATLNKGQTLGKKIFKLRVTNINGNNPSIINMLIRGLCIYKILSLLFSVVACNLFSINVFKTGYLIVNYLESLVMIVSFFMVTYKKDRRGLHDILARTCVVNEVKN